MGPGSDNPGYGRRRYRLGAPLEASMGPGSDNPGYQEHPEPRVGSCRLQWVRGLITPVIRMPVGRVVDFQGASMGPGSDNPGYYRRRQLLPGRHRASMGPGSD